MKAEPTDPRRLAHSKEWATIRHGVLTHNQKLVLWKAHSKEAHDLSANREHAARRTLILRGLLDVEGKITQAGTELAVGFRKL